MREIELILWYKGQGGKPIFTLDTRTTPLLKHLTSSTRRTDLYKSKLASASLLSKLQQSPIITTGTKRAENRFTFNLTGELAYLQIKQVAATDQSGYKCRVDYKQSRSDYHQVNLTVIGKCVANNLWSTQVIRLLAALVWHPFLRIHIPPLGRWPINCSFSPEQCHPNLFEFWMQRTAKASNHWSVLLTRKRVSFWLVRLNKVGIWFHFIAFIFLIVC